METGRTKSMNAQEFEARLKQFRQAHKYSQAISDAGPCDLEAFVQTYRPSLTVFANRILRDQEDAQDAVQETLFRALRNIGQFEIGSNPKPWLFRICQNCCTDALRHRRVDSKHYDEVFQQFLHKPSQNDPVYLEYASNAQIQFALNHLPKKYKEILVLHHFEDASLQELSQKFCVPIGTIKSWLNRGRQQLRKNLDQFTGASSATQSVSL